MPEQSDDAIGTDVVNRAPLLHRALTAVAIVSGMFFVGVSAWLLQMHVEFLKTDPLNDPAMVKAREEYAPRSFDGDPALQAKIREMDLNARRSFFRIQRRTIEGGYVAVAGAGVMLLCLGLMQSIRFPVYRPTAASGDVFWGAVARSRAWVAAGGVVILLAALALWLLFKTAIPGVTAGPEATVPGATNLSANAVFKEKVPAPRTEPRLSWPVFRGNLEFSGVAEGELSAKLKLLWSAKAGLSAAGPVLGRGKVYVVAGKVTAFDPADGKMLWQYTNETYSSSPVLAGNVLFTGDNSGRVAAFDADKGTLLWANELGGQITGSGNVYEKDGRRVFFMGSKDYWMYAFDGADGKLLWKFETGNYINGSPAVVGGEVIFGGCDATLHVVGALDGKERLAIGAGSYLGGSPATAGGRVFAGHYEGSVICADLKTGDVVWTFDTGEGKRSTFFSAPAVGAEKLVTGCRDGSVYCLSVKDGKKMWTFKASGEIDMSPVICGNKTVFGAPDGKVYLVDLESGQELWSYELGATVNDGPAVSGGKVFVGATDGKVYAFGPEK